jgi:hypothetical protein
MSNDTRVTSLSRALLIGALGFGLASLCVFATVAFGERWMYRTLTPTGAYLVWIILFIVLGGTALGSLVARRWRLPRFYLLFAGAFFAYAMGWIAAYFILHGTLGEWIGSLLGSVLMALVFALAFGVTRSFLQFSLILFIANSLGYFLGSAVNDLLHGPNGMLTWGIFYGLFLGAGIGAVLHLCQAKRTRLN